MVISERIYKIIREYYLIEFVILIITNQAIGTVVHSKSGRLLDDVPFRFWRGKIVTIFPILRKFYVVAHINPDIMSDHFLVNCLWWPGFEFRGCPRFEGIIRILDEFQISLPANKAGYYACYNLYHDV